MGESPNNVVDFARYREKKEGGENVMNELKGLCKKYVPGCIKTEMERVKWTDGDEQRIVDVFTLLGIEKMDIDGHEYEARDFDLNRPGSKEELSKMFESFYYLTDVSLLDDPNIKKLFDSIKEIKYED